MKVCLVSTVFPPAMGGPSIQTYELAAALGRKGHEATVVTPAHPGRGSEVARSLAGVRLVESQGVSAARLNKLTWKLSIARAVARELQEAPYDVVHCQNGPGAAGLLVGKVARLRGVPSFAKFPADEVLHRVNTRARVCLEPAELYRFSWRARWWSWVQERALRQHDVVWAVHSYDLKNLVEIFRFPRDRLLLFPNYQRVDLPDPEPLDKSEGAPVVLCACRLVALKGVDLLIRAFANAKLEKRVQLWILGEGVGEVVRELEVLVSALSLQDRVRFLGKVSPFEVPRYLKRASVFLNTLTNRYYGAGYVEALAAGTCIVALNLGSWPEVAPFEEIPAFVGRNVDETAAHLHRVLEDPVLRDECARRGREFAGGLDLDSHLEVFLDGYRRAIQVASTRGANGSRGSQRARR